MLTLDIVESPLVTVLRCSGRIVRGAGADTLLQAVGLQDTPNIVIDLIGVHAIDANGLGILAEVQRRATTESRTVQLMNVMRPIQQLLDITGLSSVLRIFPAVDRFAGQTSPSHMILSFQPASEPGTASTLASH